MNSPSAIGAAVWLLVISVPAAIAAYYRIFSGFAGWDDEGAFMATVKQYLSGAKLYQEIYSGYGPVYYFFNRLVRSVTGMAVDHNSVRMTSAAMVVVCSLLCAWIVLRLTRSLPAAALTHLLVFRNLTFFGNEPGHPQELCLLLLIVLTASGVLASNRHTRWLAAAAAGILAAALTLVKVNIGIFAILAVALTVLFQAPQGWVSRLGKYAAGIAVLFMPYVLMRVHMGDPATQAYWLVVTLSLAALLAGPLRVIPRGFLSSRECWVTAAGFALTLAAVLTFLAAEGVPLSRVLEMLVLRHIGLNVSRGTWYFPVVLGRIWIAWAALGLAAAFFLGRTADDGKNRWPDRVRVLQVLFGAGALLIALVAPVILLGLVTPFCWLLLCPPVNPRPGELHARMLLASLAVLQTVYAYPIAGSQASFLRVLLVIVAAVILVDGLQCLQEKSSAAATLRRFSRPAGTATMAAVALAYPVLAYRANVLYASLTPLNLPGAERIHLDQSEAEDYHWLTAQLRQNCDTFVGLPGMPSLYFWTGKPLPGPAHRTPGLLNMASWMLTYSSNEQQVIVDDLSRHPNACAVYGPHAVSFWNKANLNPNDWPLANYILTHFKTIGRTGDYQFMIRKERILNIPDGTRQQSGNQPQAPPG